MDDETLFVRQYESLGAFCRLLGNASPGATVFERDGVVAAVVPAAPDRSVVNSVAYSDAAALVRALPELGSAYTDSGVRAWTVWVRPGDDAAATALDGAGHVLDADPEAMAMELAALRAPRPEGLDLDPAPSLEVLARLNDRSYAVGGDHFQRALRTAPALHIYLARLNGVPVCCASGQDHGGDFSVMLVATLPEARGRGLAGRLLTHALHDARERGCTTTSLQATKMGQSLYRRLGYRELGALHMWERRVAA